MNEIRTEELAFTEEEAVCLLNEKMGLGIGPDDLSVLLERTEGWPAGIYLASLSLRNKEDKHAFIESFRGSNSYVVGLLGEEVLAQLPEDVRKFLLETSVLRRLTGPICDAVTGREGSARLLRELARSNLFVVSLDEQGEWYRYHHLFSDLLLYELKVKMLLDAASGDRLEGLYVLAVHTGLRQGELLGLKWDDIDLEAGALQVRRTLTTAKGGSRLAAPKTKGSRRRVSLTRVAVEALETHLERQLEEIDRAGSLWQENGLVFASETGAPLDRRDLTARRFKPLLERAGLPHFRFHDLRHTCATLLLTKNVNPKVVSEILGHSSIAITLDTYSHVLPNMQDSAARALEEALS